MENGNHSQSITTGIASAVETPGAKSSNDVVTKDTALYYLQAVQKDNKNSDHESVNRRNLVHKIDRRLLPIMFACYTSQFLDKTLVNYAAVMGLWVDLRLGESQFSWAATAFFAAYLVAEIPTGYLLQKVPIGKYLGINVVLWGIVTALTGAAQNFAGLLVLRLLLGVFEASIAPSLTLLTGKWYTKSEQATRFSFWYCGVGLGQIFGGLVSFGFQHVSGADISGWRMMFIVLGVATVGIGVWTFFLLLGTPMEASKGFLKTEEIVATLERVKTNQTGIENKVFKWAHIIELATDLQIYLLLSMPLLSGVSGGIISTYSTTVIRSFGYTAKTAALLNMPSGVVSMGSVLLSGFFISKFPNSRWFVIAGLSMLSALGGGLMSFLPRNNRAGLLSGIYLVNATVPTLGLTFNWVSANVSGQTKRSFTCAMIAASFSIGSLISPQTFQASDAPNYLPAKLTVLIAQALLALIAVSLRLLYGYKNSQKERGATIDTDEETDRKQWLDLTDKENPRFRYVY